jgi:putative hemolysin
VDDVGWLLVSLVTASFLSLFFSVVSFSLATFSSLKLNEAFRNKNREGEFLEFSERAPQYLFVMFSLGIFFNIITVLCVDILFAGMANAVLKRAMVIAISFLILFNFSLAISYPVSKYVGERLLVRITPLLRIIYMIFCLPLTWIMRAYDLFIRRLSGHIEQSHEEAHEERQDELLNVVEQSRMDGVVDEEELAMIENVLDLTEATAAEIITPRTELVAIDIESDRDTIVDTVIKAGHSRLPVYKKTIDHIVGLLYAKDLLCEIARGDDNFNIKNIMRKAYFVPESKPLRDLLHDFQDAKQHIAVVLDEYGGTAGIVTIEDILEELVGEIRDEYEKKPPVSFRLSADDVAEMDGKVYIDDLNNDFKIDLPEDEDYETVGGFVFSHLGYIPHSGESFMYGNLKFTVISATERQIKRLRIEKMAVSEEEKS